MKPKIWILALLVLFAMTVIGVISAKIDGWDTSPNTQYHIQTDEGPERFFRYQTISGQYRKEKRLQDGTVIGSYGWVDADGYLRLNDYVADNNGYRVLRTKRLYVGPQTAVDSALDASKYAPPQAGTDVSASSPAYAQPYAAYPEDKSKYLIFPSPSSSSSSSTPSPQPSSTWPPVVALAAKRRPTPPAGYYPTSTPPSVVAIAVTPPSTSVAEVAITPSPYYRAAAATAPQTSVAVAPAAKTVYNAKYAYKPPLYTAVIKPRPDDYAYSGPSNAVAHPPYYGDRVYSGVAGRKSYDETRQPNYDGVSVTRNGFRYYLPRQYHEEENSGGQERVGSFGYIDPFGIRRVIYYNASPSTGFVHRKNNRFVGFDDTPYDPRP